MTTTAPTLTPSPTPTGRRSPAAVGTSFAVAAMLTVQLGVAVSVGLFDRITQADLVITGEGFLDEQSFEGKVVGGVADLAAAAGVPVLAVVGDVFDGVEERAELTGFEAVSLVRSCGRGQAFEDPVGCIESVVAERLRERTS